jgi:hypothetical protein
LLGALAAGLIVIGFCFLLLWHDPLLFWNDDYALSVLPVFADVARSWSEGHLPLLSPYSWVCGNLAGEFQYGTFSIFVNAAVVLIWKFPLTLPQQAAALSITHLFVLAVGAFVLARYRGLSIPLSIFVALVTALNGWIICWGATDWFGALGAFAWLPWAWWGAERALDHQPRSNQGWKFLWPAPFVYLVVTGGFPYTVLMLVLLIAWLSIKFATANPSFGGSLGQTRNLLSILPLCLGTLLGFALSAPAWLAIFDYVHGSARELQSSSTHWQWIVPPAALPGFILPCWTVNWANFSTQYLPHAATELAGGLVPPVALLGGLLQSKSLFKKLRWELGLLVLVLLISMLPSANVFRWSFRWLPFFHLILALCAAEALQTLSGTPDSQSLFARPGVLAFVLVIIVAIAMSMFHTGGVYAFPFTWIFLVLAAVWMFAEHFSRNRELVRAWMPASVTFAGLLATYLCIPPNCGVPKYNLDQKLTEAAPLDPQRLYLSIYPPPELSYRVEKKPEPVGQVVRPGSTSMWAGLRFVNGYSPILPAGVARAFGFAIHGEIDPNTGKYLLEEQAGPRGELTQLGVDGIVVAREVEVEPKPGSEWQLASSTDEGRVYHRRGEPLPRVRSVTSIDSRPNEQFVSATISGIDDSRNRVEVDVGVPAAGRPALLTFSRPFFRGYEARLGGKKLAVDSYRGLIPVAELPAGSHGRLVLSYRPWWLVCGGVVAVGSCTVLLVGLLARLRNVLSWPA